MATYSNLGITLITTGDESGTWGTTTNSNFENILDEAIAGAVTHNISSDADFTLTVVDATSSDARHAVIKFTSTTLSATRTCTFAPDTLQKTWVVINATTGGQSLTFKQGSAGATVTVPNGESAIIYSDGAGATNGAITRVLDSFTNTKITTGTLNATTLDLTNLEVTNIKAKDGTAALTIADSTGKVTVSSELAVDNLNLSGNAITSTDSNGNIDLTPNGTGEVNITKVDIDSGAIDGTTIGANSAAAGTFTTATATTGNITTVNATTVDATNLEATNVKAKDGTAAITIADSTGNVALSANLTFSSTGQRITGDLTNATVTSRLALQTSTANSNTILTVLPTGTGSGTFTEYYQSGTDPANSSVLSVGLAGGVGVTRINSTITGTGTYLPLTFNTGGSERMRLDTSGNAAIGAATGAARLLVQGAGTSTTAGGNIVGRFQTNGSGYDASIQLSDNVANSAVFSMVGGAINFISNGSNYMNISAAGNVGIGTASPVSTFGTNLTLYNDANTGTVASNAYLLVQSLNRNSVVDIASSATGTGGLNFSTTPGTTLAGIAGDVANSALLFRSGGTTERMRIDSSGNVGIGTTSPGNAFVVSRGAGVAAYLQSISGSNNSLFGHGSGGELVTGAFCNQPYLFYTNSAERMRIAADGNVGIGGTAGAGEKVAISGTLPANGGLSFGFLNIGTIPSTATSVAVGHFSRINPAAASFTLTNLRHFMADQSTFGAGSTVSNQVGFYVENTLTGATNNYGFYSNIASGTNRWNFYAAGTARNYFAGNIGVGADSAVVRVFARGANTASSDYVFYGENSDPTLLFYVRNDGIVNTGVAANSPYNYTTGSAANLYVDNSGVLYRSTSSLRYKTDVIAATHGLADVLKLRSVTYKAKNDGDTVFGGLIAEEVHDAGLTEFVAYDKEGRPDALHYGNMVALLVKAVQELSAKVTALEAR